MREFQLEYTYMPTRKIKIFVDAEVLVAPHFSGIGHYTLEILHSLDQLIEDRDDVSITLGVWIKRVKDLNKYGFRNFKIRRTIFPLRVTNSLKMRGIQPPYDIFFGKKIYLFPNFTSWPLLFSKSVTIIYDLSFEHFPQYVQSQNQKFLSLNVRKSAQRSNKIVTISKNSQKEIVDFYKLDMANVPIVYPGINQRDFFRWPEEEIAKVKARYGVHGKYILFVGNIEPRKNLKNLLLAYEQLPKKTRNEYSLLLVGARGWLDNEIFEIIERLRISGNHIQQPTHYVQDKDRTALYSGASLFVYPSYYEGFGIPPLEAMACGVPVISSDNSSLPEVVGDAAIKVSADSIDELTKAISRILKDKRLQTSLIEKGYLQVDKFNWQHEAKKLLEVLMELGR